MASQPKLNQTALQTPTIVAKRWRMHLLALLKRVMHEDRQIV